MKNIVIFTLIIVTSLNCKSQTIDSSINTNLRNLIISEDFKLLNEIFNNEGGFKKYCNELNSLYNKLLFKIPTEILDSMNKRLYYIEKNKADEFDLKSPNIVDGNFTYNCDPRGFELLYRSSFYYNLTPEDRVRKILHNISDSLEQERIILYSGTLLGISISNITTDSLINIYSKIYSKPILNRYILLHIKFIKDISINYYKFLSNAFALNQTNEINYNYILSSLIYNNSLAQSISERTKIKNLLNDQKVQLENKSFENKNQIIAKLENVISVYQKPYINTIE